MIRHWAVVHALIALVAEVTTLQLQDENLKEMATSTLLHKVACSCLAHPTCHLNVDAPLNTSLPSPNALFNIYLNNSHCSDLKPSCCFLGSLSTK